MKIICKTDINNSLLKYYKIRLFFNIKLEITLRLFEDNHGRLLQHFHESIPKVQSIENLIAQ